VINFLTETLLPIWPTGGQFSKESKSVCARCSLTKEGLVITIDEIEVVITFGARYNIAPSQKAAVIIPAKNSHKAVETKWGWQPAWCKTLLINAQGETLTEKPGFKKQVMNRCLIPADGFYESTADKTPIRFTQSNEAAF
jgi:putative SOS response-associated peptidase YedK